MKPQTNQASNAQQRNKRGLNTVQRLQNSTQSIEDKNQFVNQQNVDQQKTNTNYSYTKTPPIINKDLVDEAKYDNDTSILHNETNRSRYPLTQRYVLKSRKTSHQDSNQSYIMSSQNQTIPKSSHMEFRNQQNAITNLDEFLEFNQMLNQKINQLNGISNSQANQLQGVKQNLALPQRQQQLDVHQGSTLANLHQDGNMTESQRENLQKLVSDDTQEKFTLIDVSKVSATERSKEEGNVMTPGSTSNRQRLVSKIATNYYVNQAYDQKAQTAQYQAQQNQSGTNTNNTPTNPSVNNSQLNYQQNEKQQNARDKSNSPQPQITTGGFKNQKFIQSQNQYIKQLHKPAGQDTQSFNQNNIKNKYVQQGLLMAEAHRNGVKSPNIMVGQLNDVHLSQINQYKLQYENQQKSPQRLQDFLQQAIKIKPQNIYPLGLTVLKHQTAFNQNQKLSSEANKTITMHLKSPDSLSSPKQKTLTSDDHVNQATAAANKDQTCQIEFSEIHKSDSHYSTQGGFNYRGHNSSQPPQVLINEQVGQTNTHVLLTDDQTTMCNQYNLQMSSNGQQSPLGTLQTTNKKDVIKTQKGSGIKQNFDFQQISPAVEQARVNGQSHESFGKEQQNDQNFDNKLQEDQHIDLKVKPDQKLGHNSQGINSLRISQQDHIANKSPIMNEIRKQESNSAQRQVEDGSPSRQTNIESSVNQPMPHRLQDGQQNLQVNNSDHNNHGQQQNYSLASLQIPKNSIFFSQKQSEQQIVQQSGQGTVAMGGTMARNIILNDYNVMKQLKTQQNSKIMSKVNEEQSINNTNNTNHNTRQSLLNDHLKQSSVEMHQSKESGHNFNFMQSKLDQQQSSLQASKFKQIATQEQQKLNNEKLKNLSLDLPNLQENHLQQMQLLQSKQWGLGSDSNRKNIQQTSDHFQKKNMQGSLNQLSVDQYMENTERSYTTNNKKQVIDEGLKKYNQLNQLPMNSRQAMIMNQYFLASNEINDKHSQMRSQSKRQQKQEDSIDTQKIWKKEKKQIINGIVETISEFQRELRPLSQDKQIKPQFYNNLKGQQNKNFSPQLPTCPGTAESTARSKQGAENATSVNQRSIKHNEIANKSFKKRFFQKLANQSQINQVPLTHSELKQYIKIGQKQSNYIPTTAIAAAQMHQNQQDNTGSGGIPSQYDTQINKDLQKLSCNSINNLLEQNASSKQSFGQNIGGNPKDIAQSNKQAINSSRNKKSRQSNGSPSSRLKKLTLKNTSLDSTAHNVTDFNNIVSQGNTFSEIIQTNNNQNSTADSPKHFHNQQTESTTAGELINPDLSSIERIQHNSQHTSIIKSRNQVTAHTNNLQQSLTQQQTQQNNRYGIGQLSREQRKKQSQNYNRRKRDIISQNTYISQVNESGGNVFSGGQNMGSAEKKGRGVSIKPIEQSVMSQSSQVKRRGNAVSVGRDVLQSQQQRQERGELMTQRNMPLSKISTVNQTQHGFFQNRKMSENKNKYYVDLLYRRMDSNTSQEKKDTKESALMDMKETKAKETYQVLHESKGINEDNLNNCKFSIKLAATSDLRQSQDDNKQLINIKGENADSKETLLPQVVTQLGTNKLKDAHHLYATQNSMQKIRKKDLSAIGGTMQSNLKGLSIKLHPSALAGSKIVGQTSHTTRQYNCKSIVGNVEYKNSLLFSPHKGTKEQVETNILLDSDRGQFNNTSFIGINKVTLKTKQPQEGKNIDLKIIDQKNLQQQNSLIGGVVASELRKSKRDIETPLESNQESQKKNSVPQENSITNQSINPMNQYQMTQIDNMLNEETGKSKLHSNDASPSNLNETSLLINNSAMLNDSLLMSATANINPQQTKLINQVSNDLFSGELGGSTTSPHNINLVYPQKSNGVTSNTQKSTLVSKSKQASFNNGKVRKNGHFNPFLTSKNQLQIKTSNQYQEQTCALLSNSVQSNDQQQVIESNLMQKKVHRKGNSTTRNQSRRNKNGSQNYKKVFFKNLVESTLDVKRAQIETEWTKKQYQILYYTNQQLGQSPNNAQGNQLQAKQYLGRNQSPFQQTLKHQSSQMEQQDRQVKDQSTNLVDIKTQQGTDQNSVDSKNTKVLFSKDNSKDLDSDDHDPTINEMTTKIPPRQVVHVKQQQKPLSPKNLENVVNSSEIPTSNNYNTPLQSVTPKQMQ